MLTPSIVQKELRRRCWQPCVTTVTQRSFAKKAKKKSTAAATPVEGGRDKNLELILASLNAPERKEPEISAEEKARRYDVGRNYVIGRFRQHNEIHHDLACKIQMKKHAVKMMPRDSMLKEEAMKIDGEGPPVWRHIAKWTPPIPGYNPSDFVEDDQ